MHARLATSPNIGIKRWRKGLYFGCLWNATMQVTQLSAYNTNVPKLEASVIVRKEFGRAAILSCERYPKLDQKPCGRPLMVASVNAPESPKKLLTVTHPNTAEITASVQMARCGVRFWECNNRSEEHTSNSSHLGISYAVFCLKKKKKT